MRVYDITLPLNGALAGWPGDSPYEFRWNSRLEEGAAVNLGSVGMSVHFGTHTDAPFHFAPDGATMEQVALDPFVGPAVVLDVSGHAVIRRNVLETIDLSRTPRVLFKTNAWTDYARFPESVPVLAPDLPAYLQARGVLLVGLDVPSVDALESKDLPIHHALYDCGITILESLYLTETPPGAYELIALPLKLVGADGAPVRAILRDLGR